jgi:hypothetical protein
LPSRSTKHSTFLAEYRKAPKTDWSKGHTGKNSPHIQFANADTDEKLVAYVKRFGPVVARSVCERFADQGEEEEDPATIVAEQDMTELWNERIIYHSALTLAAELEREKADVAIIRNCISKIAGNIVDWQRQRQREEHLRKANSEPEPSWRFGEEAVRAVKEFGSDAFWEPPTHWERNKLLLATTTAIAPNPVRAGHNIICELVNTFPPLVYVWGSRPIEGPHLDLRYGIRPLLYHILRQKYRERRGIGACANAQCRELFEVERAGQQYCTDVCSRQQRQREYWVKRGKQLRNKRLKRANSAARGAR